MNTVILMGRLTKDPEIRQTQSGIEVCRFSVAVNRPFVNKETNEREADFLECEAWKQTAVFIGRYFQKGSMIAVEGSLRNNNYTDNNGVKHYATKIAVDRVHFCGDSNRQNGQGSGNGNQQQYAQAGTPQQAYTGAQRGGQAAPVQNSGYQQNAPQAAYNAPQQSQRTPQNAPPNIGNLEQFVDILSDGALPF